MLKSKFVAGLVASILTLVAITIAAIVLVWFDYEQNGNDRFIKLIAFGAIAMWLGLYAWLKPKNVPADQIPKDASGNVKQVIKPRETVSNDRNARR